MKKAIREFLDYARAAKPSPQWMRAARREAAERPAAGALRCFCGKMTFARAVQRGHNCEEPSSQEGI